MGVTDLALVDWNQWLAQLALVAKLTRALLVRTDLPTYATLATHDSLSLNNDDSILQTQHFCRAT